MSNALFEGLCPPFRIWSILSIPEFQFKEKIIPFPAEHRIVFAYLSSLGNRYGDFATSYISTAKKTGINVEYVAEIFGWLMAVELLEYVPDSLFDGERVKFKYRVNYPNNTFPYPTEKHSVEK